jgi:hypothetical protein
MTRYLSAGWDVDTIRSYARGMRPNDGGFGRGDTDLSDEDATAVARRLDIVADAIVSSMDIEEGVSIILRHHWDDDIAANPGRTIDSDGNTVSGRAIVTLRNIFGAS